MIEPRIGNHYVNMFKYNFNNKKKTKQYETDSLVVGRIVVVQIRLSIWNGL